MNRIANASSFYAKALKRGLGKETSMAKAAFSPSKTNAAYLGWTGHNNLGDEILLLAHQKLFPKLSIIPFQKSKLLSIYNKLRDPYFSVGILGGGTLINQSDKWLDQICYLKQQGIAMFCLGTGVTENSPSKESLQHWVEQLQNFKFVGVRGPYSKKILESAGLKNSQVIGDTALALAPNDFNVRKPNKIIGINYGLTANSNIFGDLANYKEQIIATINMLINNGYTVHLLPVWSNDIPSNKDILSKVNNSHCKLICKFDTLNNYQAELNKCSLFLGQKLHSTIIACMLRIPSIMLEYQPKCRDFMASIQMEQYTLRTSNLTPDNVMRLIQSILEKYDEIQTTINKEVITYKNTQFKVAAEIQLGLEKNLFFNKALPISKK
jgi:polysaccharide pyruvyl transferase WcaK-like protein